MIRPALMLALICAGWLAGPSNAGLDERTKKLLQSQAINHPPAQSTFRKYNTPDEEAARQGGSPGRVSGQPPGSRGSAESVPPQKPLTKPAQP